MLDYEAYPPRETQPKAIGPATEIRRRFVYASGLLLLFSLTQSGYTTDFYPNDRQVGLGPFLCGCLGPCAGGVFAWYANPLLFVSWYLMWRPFDSRTRLIAVLCAGLSLALSLTFLLHSEIMVNEAGHVGKIMTRGWSYWLWIISIAIALAGAVTGHQLEE